MTTETDTRPSKLCSSCRLVKPYADFQRRTAARDGLQARCRSCQGKAMAKYYRQNRVDRLAYAKAHNSTVEAREEQWAREAMLRARSFDSPVIERVNRLDVFRRDGWFCTLCGEPMRRETGQHPRSATIDHTVPLRAGGSHTLANCTSAHRSCNRTKAGDPLATFWEERWAERAALTMPLGQAVVWTLLDPRPDEGVVL